MGRLKVGARCDPILMYRKSRKEAVLQEDES